MPKMAAENNAKNHRSTSKKRKLIKSISVPNDLPLPAAIADVIIDDFISEINEAHHQRPQIESKRRRRASAFAVCSGPLHRNYRKTR